MVVAAHETVLEFMVKLLQSLRNDGMVVAERETVIEFMAKSSQSLRRSTHFMRRYENGGFGGFGGFDGRRADARGAGRGSPRLCLSEMPQAGEPPPRRPPAQPWICQTTLGVQSYSLSAAAELRLFDGDTYRKP